MRSDDSGKTWVEVRPNAYYMNSIGRTLYVNDTGQFRSTDLESTWDSLSITPPFPYDRCLPLSTGEYVVGVSYNWPITMEGYFKSYDGGKRWLQVGGRQIEKLYSIGFFDDTIYAGSESLWKNVDWKNQWEYVPRPYQEHRDIVDVNITGDTTYLVSQRNGEGPNLSRSDDRGKSWLGLRGPASVGDSTRIVNAAGTLFSSGRELFQTRGYLSRSTDHGESWKILPLDSSGLYSVDSKNVVFHGGELYVRGHTFEDSISVLFRSSDMGDSWEIDDAQFPYMRYGKDRFPILLTAGDRLITQLDSTGFVVYQSADTGRQIIRYNNPIHTVETITCLDSVFYVLVNDPGTFGVRATRNLGRTWYQIDNGLSGPVFKINAQFYVHENRLFLIAQNRIHYLGTTPSFHLTVENGYGSGYYPGGDTVHIWSRELNESEVFDTWSTPVRQDDIKSLALSDEWHTTLVMPHHNVTVRANIQELDRFDSRFDTVHVSDVDRIAHTVIPDDPKAHLLLLHNENGSAADWFEHVEEFQFVRDALANDFIVSTLSAEEVITGDLDHDGVLQWRLIPDFIYNGDAEAAMAVVDRVKKMPILQNEDLPVFIAGTSNGGDFASTMISIPGFKAGALYCADGAEELVPIDRRYGSPVIFCLAGNDTDPIADRPTAESYHQSLMQNGIKTEFRLHEPSPLYPERFARIEGIDTALSCLIFAEFERAGFLDQKHYLLLSPDSLLSVVEANPTSFPALTGLSSGMRQSVREQLNATYAGHEFYSDLNKTTLRFFAELFESNHVDAGGMKDASLRVIPHPARSEFSVVFTAARPGTASVGIYDLLGRRVRYIETGNVEAGDHTVRFTGERLDPGSYIIRLDNAGGATSTSLLVLP